MSWYEFITADDSATTHVAYVYDDGSVYLPEGPAVVTETDFHMASATNRFWKLVREDVADRQFDGVCHDPEPHPRHFMFWKNDVQMWCQGVRGGEP